MKGTNLGWYSVTRVASENVAINEVLPSPSLRCWLLTSLVGHAVSHNVSTNDFALRRIVVLTLLDKQNKLTKSRKNVRTILRVKGESTMQTCSC